ncbi:hypothetical protein GCM10022203_00020 [Micrococcus yunnanensis]
MDGIRSFGGMVMVASSPLTATLARTLIDRVTLGSSGTHCRSAETDTGPCERAGWAAAAAREVDGAGLAEVAAALVVGPGVAGTSAPHPVSARPSAAHRAAARQRMEDMDGPFVR